MPSDPSRSALADMREDYRQAELDEKNSDADPIRQFEAWLENAKSAGLKEPNSMSLATATPEGRPSNRIVLLKDIDGDGFVFYTSYESRKGRELAANPKCALTFLWAELERQVRVEGKAVRVSREQTETYFKRRPKGSRLGALVSNQSEVLPNRAPLIDKLAQLEAQYADIDDVPTPEYWGGYRVVPSSIEFWQGRTNRLHDRLLYTKTDNGWRVERLSP